METMMILFPSFQFLKMTYIIVLKVIMFEDRLNRPNRVKLLHADHFPEGGNEKWTKYFYRQIPNVLVA